MLKKHSLLFSTLLLAVSLHLNAQEGEKGASSLTRKEEIAAAMENTTIATSGTCLPFTGAIIGSKVRMRVQPSLEGYVVRETTNGEMFVVAGEMNDYYAVIPPKETKGFVFRTFILDGMVEGERVNVRLFPDIDAPVIGQLNRGDKVVSVISDVNNKWLEIDLPENSRFFIAKEYIENKGGPELFATIEKKRAEAVHLLSAASLFAQAEIQKSFEQIDLDCINDQFEQIAREYHDLPVIVEQVRDTTTLMQDIYVQKKVAFLEGKASHKSVVSEIEHDHLEKLAKLGSETSPFNEEKQISQIVSAATKTIGLASTLGDKEITDKMLIWQPLEESLYHLWAATNGEKTIEEFYAEEEQAAMFLTGIVEPYNRPVKNRPGDFLLRNDNMPVAFLYSTHINLEKLVGQKVTLLATPRPNHNFAFPAYFVISVE
jgi:Bacterial SH3 domain